MTDDFSVHIIFTSPKIDSRRDVERLEDDLAALEGVRHVNADPESHTVDIVFDPTVISATALYAEVERLGYKIESSTEQERIPI